MSVSTEDFLKHIYMIKYDMGQKVSSSMLAGRLTVSNAAITDMSRKMSEKGWIRYEKYKEITLTPKGRKEALRIIRRHRLWETFLHEVLGMSRDEVHLEAERLEHSSSDELMHRIDKYLGRPAYNPLGEPIPGNQPDIQDQQRHQLLAESDPGEYLISRLKPKSDELARFFLEAGLFTGTPVTIKEVMREDRSLKVNVKGRDLVLSPFISSHIMVTRK